MNQSQGKLMRGYIPRFLLCKFGMLDNSLNPNPFISETFLEFS
jgi:hypothetical protein